MVAICKRIQEACLSPPNPLWWDWGAACPRHFEAGCSVFEYNCAPEQFEKFAYLYANAPSQDLVLRALGETDGKQVAYHIMASGSSILPGRSDIPPVNQQWALKTLNSLLAGEFAADFLKIDAQGS